MNYDFTELAYRLSQRQQFIQNKNYSPISRTLNAMTQVEVEGTLFRIFVLCCIVLYLYIYIELLAMYTNQKQLPQRQQFIQNKNYPPIIRTLIAMTHIEAGGTLFWIYGASSTAICRTHVHLEIEIVQQKACSTINREVWSLNTCQSKL